LPPQVKQYIPQAVEMISENKLQQAKTADILSLIPTQLKKVSTHNGGEYAGPCPWCGGDDRFRAWPETGRYWCRQCNRKGDTVDLIRELQGVTFADAVDRLAGGLIQTIDREQIEHQETDHTKWQTRASEFVEYASNQLDPNGTEYLASRGIGSITTWALGLGWNPKALHDQGERWGIDGSVYLGEGLVIPHKHNEQITAINIRTPEGYRIVKGSKLSHEGQRLIYKPDHWPVKAEAILFEGEIDAITGWQALNDPDVVTGAIPAGNLTSNDQLEGRNWYVCFDTDQAGKDASAKAAEMGAEIIALPGKYKDFNEFYIDAGNHETRKFLYRELKP